MMDFRPYLEECRRKCDSGEEISVCVPAGCRELYHASQSKKEKEELLHVLKSLSDVQDKKNPAWGNTWFFLYDRTAEAQYREAVDACAGRLFECRKLKSWQSVSQTYPFYMEYETRCHNKAGYADIVKQLKDLKVSSGASDVETGWYLMTVISVMDYMSMEIFEHYKSLEEIFKHTVRNILTDVREKDFDKKESAMMGYSILKACNMGVLNREKYAKAGRFMIDDWIDEPFDPKDSEMSGIAMMAYAQYLILNSN